VETVFFLGAGAAAADGAPLQSQLFRDYFQLARSTPPGNPMERDLATFFLEMFRIDVDQDNLENVEFPTFEEVIGILDLAVSRGETFRNYDLLNIGVNSNRIGLLRYYLVLLMATVINRRLPRGQNETHGSFVDNLVRTELMPRVRFVTTNYDLLLDRALMDHGLHIDYGVDDQRWGRGGTLFKLHGSLNWLFCRTCSKLSVYQGKVVHRLRHVDQGFTCDRCGTLLSPIIVPPTFYKNMSNPYLTQVWHRAEHMLHDVKHIVFCGYSFPDADMHIKYLLKRVQTNGKRRPVITVCNNFQDKSHQQFDEEKHRYRRFLGSDVNYTEYSFQDVARDPGRFCSGEA
jgi:NAD-dependent SIR2 family protein deacetylase